MPLEPETTLPNKQQDEFVAQIRSTGIVRNYWRPVRNQDPASRIRHAIMPLVVTGIITLCVALYVVKKCYPIIFYWILARF